MILEMSRISIVGLHSQRKAILEELHKLELVEICQPEAEGIHFPETAKSIAQFERYMNSTESALAVLDEYAPEKSKFFAGRRSLPIRKYHMSSADSDAVLHAIYHIIGLSEKIQENTQHIGQIIAKQAVLEPYLALDVPLSWEEQRYTLSKIGALPGAWTESSLQNELNSDGLDAHFELLGASKERSHVWIVFLHAQEEKAEAFLQKNNFIEQGISSHRSAAKKKQALEDTAAELMVDTQRCVDEIKEHSRFRRDMELFYDHLCLRKEKYQVLSKTGLTDYTFFVEGYTPKKHGARIKKLLEDQYTAHVELTVPETPEDVPVAFQNRPFSAPVEGITETYSMPSSTDIDPNPIMAFFYYLFFGLMFSDAGYGLLMVLACGYLGFSKRFEPQKQKNFRMFFFCGLSTMFWGLMFGGFFGNVIYTVSDTFFGTGITLAPLWLDPISQAMNLLLFSVALGMAQILIGLGIKFYNLCRQKKPLDALLDVGTWMLVLIGICILACGFGLKLPLLSTAGIWTAIAGAAGILLAGGRKSKKITGKLFGGVAKLYDITGYVSDALSYCRLMALGLATGAIANVVNMLGSMFGKSFFGVLLFAVIFLAGHALNFAMNALGAYVHTNRLQYVEFFSKFYEGGGRKFEPFRMHTKYYRFSADIKERAT